ncbi:MAG: UDP-N-acetylmuramate dehydrogenase [Clostridia bacterium]|jgi:UDP-N-acetylmuramate dehydrogenase|nr:UDP-N-acetylmuramate dehydrogenase [Clostridia bacterium]
MKNRLIEILSKDRVLENESMKEHTTFKIGGKVKWMVLPKSKEEIIDVIKLCREENYKYEIIGNGSNLLVSDNDMDILVIKIDKNMSSFEIKDDILEVSAGIVFSTMAKKLSNLGYKNFEYATGIPGSLGGAIYMNAGAYGGEIKENLISVTYISENGDLLEKEIEHTNMGYRSSMFQNEKCIILSAKMLLEKGEKEEILAKVKDLTSKRIAKQPIDKPSAGSTFKWPDGVEHTAAWFIEQYGFKGYKIGGAQVSEKHSGFVINTGNATAEDVINLTNHIKEKIIEKYGVELHLEVKKIGEF